VFSVELLSFAARASLRFAADSDPEVGWQAPAAACTQGSKPPIGMDLIERHADSIFFAPDHMTGPVDPVGRDRQREMFGDADGAADVQGGP
jgi:hypothetical protein